MRWWLFAPVAMALLLALAACAAQEKEAAKPAPAAPAAAPEAILPRKDAWQEEWERVLEAAKREGKVVAAAPVGAELRRALTEPFQRKHGITVEHQGFAGPEFPTRLRAEREAGRYLWDIFIGGTTTMITALKPIGALDPIEPAFILPEVKDLKNWQEGKLLFADNEQKFVLPLVLYTRPALFVNTSLVKPEEFKSYRDLLDPKWKGKIVVKDPRVAGAGQASFTFFYAHSNLGPDFIRALLRQDLQVMRDDVEAAQWLAQGKYPLLIGVGDRFVIDLQQQRLPVTPIAPGQMREGGDMGPASGALVLINKAPHPNAAKVYINWLLSREGATEFSKGIERPSRRVDVPTDHLHPSVRAVVPGSIDTFTEQAQVEIKAKVLPFLTEVFGR